MTRRTDPVTAGSAGRARHDPTAGSATNPEALAALSARAYAHQTPWSAQSFAATLALPSALLVAADHAFVLGTVICDEAEILALATDPGQRRAGLARALLTRFEMQAAARGALRVLLEVAADNRPARALYDAAGYAETGRRRAYYRRAGAAPADAVLMGKALPHRR